MLNYIISIYFNMNFNKDFPSASHVLFLNNIYSLLDFKCALKPLFITFKTTDLLKVLYKS